MAGSAAGGSARPGALGVRREGAKRVTQMRGRGAGRWTDAATSGSDGRAACRTGPVPIAVVSRISITRRPPPTHHSGLSAGAQDGRNRCRSVGHLWSTRSMSELRWSRRLVARLGLLALTACEPSASSAPPTATAAPASADLVYERRVNGNLDIYVVSSGGGVERRLTRHPADDALPRWTPDGRAVIFSSARSGSWQLWEVPAASGEPSEHPAFAALQTVAGGRKERSQRLTGSEAQQDAGLTARGNGDRRAGARG